MGVTPINNTAILNLNATSTLTIDLSSYDFDSFAGSDIVLFDYGTLSGTFGTVNIIGGKGTLNYSGAGGQILLEDVGPLTPEPASLVLMLAGLTGLCWWRPRRKR